MNEVNKFSMDTIGAIRTRYSCRAFSDRMPSDEELRTIAEAAAASPSGMNRHCRIAWICGESRRQAP